MQFLQASDLIPLSPSARAQLVLETIDSVKVPRKVRSELHLAYKISTVLTPALPDFIQHQIQIDAAQGTVLERIAQSNAIAAECDQFSNQFINSVPGLVRSKAEREAAPSNLYEMAGADLFTVSNSISRKLSTAMGSLWERIADISPYSISPERDFHLKITGVDSIIMSHGSGLPTFVQIKTQRNTLTGSQSNRSKTELKLHDNRLFAAAFCTGGSWTFSGSGIRRVCGADFWELLGLDYETLESHVKQMILKIQTAYMDTGRVTEGVRK
ncbi:MAG: hypothetical protein F6J87_25895 [Spirulina sp. SIO3F2]|nr:hypothetical protein [Spirulina sp. SIO3F2]